MSFSEQPCISIDGKKIGSNFDPYFIAEAGLNHNGDINLAKKMIDAALDCGADAIKFQTYISENFLTLSSEYFKFFKDVELKPNEFKELHDHAKERGITFFSAPFDIESANNLKQIEIPCFKIASSDLTNFPLIKHIAKMQKPMIISTGIGTLQEIQDALDICKSVDNGNVALLHSVANYPTQLDETNLAAIKILRDRFNVPVGYSDNGESSLVDIVAVSLGASIIEKHFTLDKNLFGPDHIFSIEPNNLKNLIHKLKLIKKIKGISKKEPQPSELTNMKSIRKCIVAASNLIEGEIITSSKLAIKRPQSGIEPKFFDEIIGKKINKNIDKDSPIQWNDLI
jgi:N,N'-diacetyllegionaminate synthase